MKKEVVTAILLLALGAPGTVAIANAQAKSDQKPTFGGTFDRSAKGMEQEIVPAAEAMPEDKFNYAPTQGEFKGVRTFAQQVKHIAATNYMFAAGILGEKPPVELGGENGPDSMTSKADIVKFLKDSFTYLHKALDSMNESTALAEIASPFGSNKTTRLRLAIIAVSHPWDHYGQMVEYLRANGIVPPASRAQ
ncbi:MAG TPA: DinB family protein [Terriglobales bacterium]|nr:DinB family protein [Terriglobales bacterium]